MTETASKINLLFVLPQLNAGGTERMVLKLARCLGQSRFAVYVAFFFDGNLREEYNKVCQGMFHVPKEKNIDFQAMKRIAGIIHQNHIHVINAQHYMPFFYSFLGAKALHRRRLFYTEHSVAEVKRITGPHRFICKAMLRHTDGVVGVSKEISKSFAERFPCNRKRITCVPNGLDLERFKGPSSCQKIREELQISPEHFVVGTIANFRKVKNHGCLIRAFHRLSCIYPDMRLVLVGRGSENDMENTEEQIKELISNLRLDGKVVLTGYREDIPELLRSFDVFCLPSLSEGLPLSILEAMAAGVSVIGSDVVGIRELIIHEKTGLLFPSNDHGALGRSIEKLFEKPSLRSRIVENALQFVSANHSLKLWSKKYERLFAAKPLWLTEAG